MALALGSIAILVFTVVLVGWSVARIRNEEPMLVAEFGEAYRSYRRRTQRLIPFPYRGATTRARESRIRAQATRVERVISAG